MSRKENSGVTWYGGKKPQAEKKRHAMERGTLLPNMKAINLVNLSLAKGMFKSKARSIFRISAGHASTGALPVLRRRRPTASSVKGCEQSLQHLRMVTSTATDLSLSEHTPLSNLTQPSRESYQLAVWPAHLAVAGCLKPIE